MKSILAPVISNEQVMPGVYLLWAEAPEIASAVRPGQFVMVRTCGDYERLLRRPLSVHRIKNNGEIALLYEVIGRGTEWLSQREAGEDIDLLGPLGNGFRIEARNLLLVAGGCGIAPLVFLAERALADGGSARAVDSGLGRNPTVLLEGRTTGDLLLHRFLRWPPTDPVRRR